MNIVLDARMAFHGGIGRYCRELARTLQARDGLRLTLLARKSDGSALAGANPCARVRLYERPLYGIREQMGAMTTLRRAVSDDRPTVFHFPHFNAPWNIPANSIVTVHDLIPWSDPATFGRLRPWAASRLLRRVLLRAGRVLTVSDATRRRLARRFPGIAGKVATVPPGVGPPFCGIDADEAERIRRVHGRYVLHVGNGKPHKDRHTVVEAWKRWRRYDSGLGLLLVGGRPVNGRGVRALGWVPDIDLARWYGGAVAVAVASRDEGFGFPALEAMACGAPVIASDIPALREVLGGAGVHFAAGNAEQLAELALALARDPERRARLSQAGQVRAASFRWRETSSRTLAAYRAVAR